MLFFVLRLPANLEKRLATLFPKIRDREKFVTEVLTEALDGRQSEEETPIKERMVGGTIHLFSDGGSRGNPGQAAIAYILEDPIQGVVLKEGYERIGIETNNVAEYRALIEGLKAALAFQPNRLICHLDSELVVKQLNGEYRVKMPALQVYFDEIQQLASELPDVIFTHIPREDNYRADALVNRALDEMPAPRSPQGGMGPSPHVPQYTTPNQPSLFQQRPLPHQRPGDNYRESMKRS